MSLIQSASKNSSVLQFSCPPLVVDPEGTRYRENAFAFEKGKAIVMVALPPERFLSMPSFELLQFAIRTFRLSNTIPLNDHNSALLTRSCLKEQSQTDCICVEFPVENPSQADIKIKKVTGCRTFTKDEFESSSFFPAAMQALSAVAENLPQSERESYLGREKSDFSGLLNCLNSHAYRLVHLFLSRKGVPHIFHSPADGYKKVYFGKGGIEGEDATKLPLGSPLRKIACFINVLQLAKYIREGDFPFSGSRVEALIDNLNNLRDAKHSAKRKAVISDSLRFMQDGTYDSQSSEFKNRSLLLNDHIAHSAPLPQDAWKMLVSPAIDSETKRQIILQANDNPHYALALLYEVNRCGKISGNRVKVKEDIDIKGGKITLQIETVRKPLAGEAHEKKKTRNQITTLQEDLGASLHKLHKMRVEAIQRIAGCYTTLEHSEPFVPSDLVSFSRSANLEQFLEQCVYAPLLRIGYTIKTERAELADLSFFRVTFNSRTGRSYTYETAPLNHEFKENKMVAVAELLNFIARKIGDFTEAQIALPEELDKCLPADLKRTGINKQMLSIKGKGVGQKSSEFELSYMVRLLGNSFQLKREVSIPVGLSDLKMSPQQLAGYMKNARTKEELTKIFDKLVQVHLDREVPLFLGWVADQLKLRG